jgi:ferredoxin
VIAHCEFTGIDVPPEFANARRGRSEDDVIGNQPKRARANAFVDLDADNPESETEDRLFERIRQLQILNASTILGEKAGFTIVPHEDILKMYKRAATDVTAANINASRSANITWPKLDKWTKEAWIKFDTDWWDCVVEAVQNGVYQFPMSLVKLHIVSDVQLDLGIASSDWFTISEIDFIRKVYGHLGPNNKEEAIVLLKQTQCIVHSTNIKPDVFLAVLSAYNTKFLRTLDLQIAPSIKKWPAHGQVKYGPVELVSIRKAFKDGFAASKDRSESCKHCFEVCTQNPTMPHKDLYTKLRVHFQEDVKALQRPTLHGGSAIADTKQSNSRDGRVNGGRGGGVSGRRDSSPRDSSPGKRGRERPAGGPKFPVVAGKDRCVYCGDYTNHYGHGASMCPVKGTKHAKPANYKWKASDQEPKPIIPDDDYKQLKKDKAEMFKQNAANRIQYRAKTANKVEQYSSFAADVALITVDSCSPPDPHIDAESAELVTHDGQPFLETPPPRSTMIDIVQMGERFLSKADALSLEDIGYSERFFAVAKFHSAASSVINQHSTYKHALHFTRDVTAGRYKRAPRCIHVEVGASHTYNIISPSALSQGSAFGKLKIVEEKKLSDPQTDPRRMVLLTRFSTLSVIANYIFTMKLSSGNFIFIL